MRKVSRYVLRGMIAAGTLGLLLTGCANSAGPSEAAAREVFEDKMHAGLSKGSIHIKSFQKTGGPTHVPPGSTYVLAFRAELECLKDYTGFYCGRGCKQGTVVRVEEGAGRIKISYDAGNASSSGGPGLATYEEENKWAGLQFAKTWRGWRANNGKVY